jgi:BON domain/SPW repeat
MRLDRWLYVPSIVSLLVGLWLVIAPWALGETPASQPGVFSVVLSGVVIALLAAGNIRGATRSRVLSWLLAVLGAWVFVTPFLFGYAPDAAWTWNAVISGLTVCALGIVDAMTWPVAMTRWDRSGRRALAEPMYGWEDFPLWGSRLGRDRGGDDGEFRGVGPRGWRRPDEQILADVCGRMADHARLDAGDIEVLVANGEVMLQGSVASRFARRLAEDIADSVTGVCDVTNQLRVREGRGEVRRVA